MAEGRPHEPADERRDDPRQLPAAPTRPLSGGDFVVRAFLLADHAAAPPDGKLYINGGGVTTVNLRDHGQPLPTLYLVGRVGVPYLLANEPHQYVVRLLDGDRRPVLDDPLFVLTGEVGRPAGTRPEDDLCYQFVVGLHGLPALAAGVVFFHLAVDDRPLAALPLRITRPQQSHAAVSG